MKKLITILFVLFFVNILYSQSGWFQQTSGVNTELRDVFMLNENTGWVAGWINSLLKTTNGGINWINKSPANQSYWCVYFLNEQTGWTGGGNWSAGNRFLLKTTNGGNNWTTLINENIRCFYDITFINSMTGWLSGGYGYLTKTTDGGNTFTNLKISDNDLGEVEFINVNTGWTTGALGTILKTTNGGINWINQTTTAINFASIDMLDVNTGYICGRSGAILKTTNGGNNWIIQTTGDTINEFVQISFHNTLTGWAAGGIYSPSSSKIVYTSNGGVNWITQVSPVQQWLSGLYFINQYTGYAAGLNGLIIKTTTGGLITNISKLNNDIPQSYKLYNNYPNPFNPSTNIKYDILKTGIVNIVIYDMIGQELEKLVNEVQSPGTYEVIFNAPQYSSGVYYYKLTTDNYSETKKMILLK